jgi:hypothetical protein
VNGDWRLKNAITNHQSEIANDKTAHFRSDSGVGGDACLGHLDREE